MNRCACGCAVLLAAGLLSGCVERRYVITSDPPGAVVFENGKPIGATPVDGSFVYYGNYHFTLQRDGCDTLQVDQHIPTPWYEWFPIEFFSENVIPWRIKDVRRFHYALPPQKTVRSDEAVKRAQELRERAAAIGEPAKAPTGPTPQPPPPPIAPPPPP